ncbi:transposase domain-containing protein [Trichococcus ilyis]|uniref:transposase domain-containing protein n=1 Tax=Trichococcus ilyis TaxID=640938 RepID=UPI0008386136
MWCAPFGALFFYISGLRLSLAETAKANGIDFYEYIKKLFLDLPNMDIHQNTAALNQYLPWSKKIKDTCSVTA